MGQNKLANLGYIIFWMANVGEFSFLHLIGVELEKVGDDFGFGRW